jgi:hypothetical protein
VDRAEVGTGGSKVDASPADGAGDAKDANLCNQPVAGCTSPAIVGCDPVCQSGCGCKEKCSRGVDGTAVCQPSGGFQNVGDPCTVNNPGLANQSDNCVAGAVCLSDSGTNPRCFALCNTSADCASHGALCVNHYLAPSGSSPSVRVCDPPLMACDPFAAGAAGNCANCYVTEPSSTGTSQTVCEYWSGPRARDTDLCQSSGDCSGRLVCPQVSTAARFHLCSILCDLSGNHGCPINQACILIGNRYGFCSS